MFPSDLRVRFHDYFGELRPKKVIPYGNEVLYDVMFRHPVRKGEPYLLKAEYNMILSNHHGSQGSAWRFNLHGMGDQDLDNIRVHLSSTERPFKSVQPLLCLNRSMTIGQS